VGDSSGAASPVDAAERRDLYRTSRVAVVPLRAGSGDTLNVAEALHEGLPLVTTPIGALGLPGLDQVVPICDSPEGFAAAVCNLLDDDALWATQRAAQIAYAKRWGEAAFRARLLDAAGIAQSAAAAPRNGRELRLLRSA
jgi:O-antigen biosynthesis protein